MRQRLQAAWYSFRAAFGYGLPGKTVKPKNPRRVEGGRKAALTRKANAAYARYCAEHGIDPADVTASRPVGMEVAQ